LSRVTMPPTLRVTARGKGGAGEGGGARGSAPSSETLGTVRGLGLLRGSGAQLTELID
jgi:hypothetical protein